MNNLKIIDCMRGKAWFTPTRVSPFGNCSNSLFNKQKSIANIPPVNTLLNYYTVLSANAHCPANYARKVLDARDELPDSEEAFNASQMNINLQNMFAIDAAAADGSELDISGYKKIMKEFENSIEFKDACYYIDHPWIENRVNRVPSNFHLALKVLDRTITSMRKNILEEAYNEVFFQQEKDGIFERLKIQPEEFRKFIWIPHRPVIKNTEQVITKIRPVFNSSLKTHGNYSLNEAAYPGIILSNN